MNEQIVYIGIDELVPYENNPRVDDLFFEYARLIKGLQPKVFIAENVSGLVKGTAKGYFKMILQSLKDCGYEVKVRLMKAKYMGVPQIRDKRKSLEGVLVPVTAKWNEDILRQCGFRKVDCFWRCLNFAAWVAIK